MTSAKEPGCIFCAPSTGKTTRKPLGSERIAGHSVVMMNKYPYNNGHLLLAPKRHENNLDPFTAEEYSDLNEALRRAIEIVRNSLQSRRHQPRDESRQMRRRRYRGSSALACRAALGRAIPILCPCSARLG